MRIALGLEYDGSRFLGWQTQPGGGTVQDALEKALSMVAGSAVSVVAAGRTDRGVHAREQVNDLGNQLQNQKRRAHGDGKLYEIQWKIRGNGTAVQHDRQLDHADSLDKQDR